jgi:hypothetical protein
MSYTKNFCGVLVLLVAGSACAGAAEPAAQPEAAPDSDARLTLLRQLAERVQVATSDGGKLQPVKILPELLYRYSEESRTCPDAVVWAWGDGGRPKALLTLSCQFTPRSKDLRYEFDSLSDKPLVCTIDGQERWRPHGPATGMKIVPGAPAPAEDKAGRMRQIEAILARLQATEVTGRPAARPAAPAPAAAYAYGAPAAEAGDGPAPKDKTSDLAWTAKPVYSYSDAKEGITDGAIFFAGIGKDPEVMLVLEAQRREKTPPGWYFGFNRIALAELHVRLDKNECWKSPRGNSSWDKPYHTFTVSMPGNGDAAKRLQALLQTTVQRSVGRETRYVVPSGDATALVAYIAGLSRYKPEDPVDVVEHGKKFRRALDEAARAILKQEKDPQSDACEVARYILLANRVYRFASAEVKEQRHIVADVNDYLDDQFKKGNAQTAIILAGLAAKAIQQTGQWDWAIKTYTSFAARGKKSDDEAIVRWAATMTEAATDLRNMSEDAPKPSAKEILPSGKLATIDLSKKANRETTDWENGSFQGNGLAELALGDQVLGGVKFRITEKKLQLRGAGKPAAPAKIEGIAVAQKVHRLYFLQATEASVGGTAEGTLLAEFKMHYADGSAASMPVAFGLDVREWWFDRDRETREWRCRAAAWCGRAPIRRRQKETVR